MVGDEKFVPAAFKSPQSVPTPIGTITTRGDDFAVMNQDHTMEERPSPLPETNATRPDRPASPDTFWGKILFLLTGWRVSPNGKIIVPLDKGNGTVYWQWFLDVQGAWTMDKMLVDGNGYFDTAGLYDFMCSPSGGDLQHIIDEINQNGTWYEIVERFDFSVAPERFVEDDGTIHWLYVGQECSYELTPHLFATRTNRRKTKQITWITAGGVNNVSDATYGEEHWPLVADQVAAQPRSMLRRYPSLPCLFNVHIDSLVVDGKLVDPVPGSISIMADAYCFQGSDTYVRELGSGNWYLADQMLKRVPEPYAATAFDYRCYVSEDGVTPWMGNRGYRSPIPAWKRWK